MVPTYFLKNIYLFRESEREAETQAEGEAAPCRKPDVRLDPRSPGSHPKLQVALNRCATRAAQNSIFFICRWPKS